MSSLPEPSSSEPGDRGRSDGHRPPAAEAPVHPKLATAVLLIGVVIVLIALAALSTFG